MERMIKILVVEDDMIIAAKISLQLSNLGYEVTGIEPRGEDAIRHFAEELPDLVLLDINLKGKLDGIQTAHEMQKNGPVPIIYLTANADEATFERAKVTRPQAFISKPFNQLDLQRAIELTISRLAEAQQSELPKEEQAPDAPFILDDRIFVRHKEKMVKLMISDILSVEAERNYCRIFTRQKEYLLSITLKMIEERLPNRSFLRVHRSHLINLAHVDEVGENHVMMGQHLVPVSDSFRDQLLKRIQTF